jgi:hypothetical protein
VTADAKGPVKRLTEASAKTAANYIEGEIWRVWQTSDDLLIDQTINFLIGMSDNLHEVVRNSLESLADGAGVSAPVNLVGANVIATLLTDPITEPIEDVEHGLELVGILVGLVTGIHPLVMTCAKYLIHDEISRILSEGIKNALDSTFKSLERAFTAEPLTVAGLSEEGRALFDRAGQIWSETIESESPSDPPDDITGYPNNIPPPYTL